MPLLQAGNGPRERCMPHLGTDAAPLSSHSLTYHSFQVIEDDLHVHGHAVSIVCDLLAERVQGFHGGVAV